MIALVQDRKSILGLPAQNILFCRAVGVHRSVTIEVIRSEIRDDGDVRIGLELGQVVELKAAQFDDHPIGRVNFIDDRQETLADVSPQPGLVCPRTQ